MILVSPIYYILLILNTSYVSYATQLKKITIPQALILFLAFNLVIYIAQQKQIVNAIIRKSLDK